MSGRRPSSRRPRQPRRTTHRGARSGGAGPTFAWLILILVVAGGAFAALALRDGDDSAPAEDPPTQADVSRVTFPEGLRREDIAAILAQETGLSPERYLALTAPGARGRALARAGTATSLEGFLFPATYEIGPQTTAADLVDEQIAAYERSIGGIDYAYARSRNLTQFDVLTIAAMVEREVRAPAERAVVAGVIYNRLRGGIQLGIDATVQYAIGEWKTELSSADLDVDSPYNTRKFVGLPPGPICNPGVASILAAARPRRHDFIYYVARNDGTGRHYFARTAAEFEQFVAQAAANGGG